MVKKWLLLFVVAVLLFVPSLGHTKESNAVTPHNDSADDGPAEEQKISTADVILDIITAGNVPVEIRVKIEYYRYGLEDDFVLSVDEAGDRALGTTLIAFRTAGKKISSDTLRSIEGVLLLEEKVWVVLGHFNTFPHEPVKVVGITIMEMVLDPDPESLGRPTMFFIDEESGDAKVGI